MSNQAYLGDESDEFGDTQSRSDEEQEDTMGANNVELVDGSPAWKTRDKRLIEVSKITNAHLTNIIRMIRRMHDAKVQGSCHQAGGNGSMEDAVEALDMAGPELTCYRAYPRLLEEALARGLKIPHGASGPVPTAQVDLHAHACPGRDAEPGAPHVYEKGECLFCKGIRRES